MERNAVMSIFLWVKAESGFDGDEWLEVAA
jgi:hypothetical protein